MYLTKLISVGDKGRGSGPELRKSWNRRDEASEAPVVFEASECDRELLVCSGIISVLILIRLDLELPMSSFVYKYRCVFLFWRLVTNC